MHDPNSTERVSAALARAVNHWQRSRVAGTGQTIAISREAGTRGSQVARAVGEQLGWVVYDHELLEQIARELKVRVSLLESVDERHVPWLEEQVEAFSRVPYVSEGAFFRQLVQTILSLGLHGECVILGRGANFILPSRSTLRVRLVASLEDRVGQWVQEFGVSRNEAARIVKETDQQRTAFIKEHFHQDAGDSLHYDLTLNTSRLTVEECSDLIVSLSRKLDARMRLSRPASQPAEMA